MKEPTESRFKIGENVFVRMNDPAFADFNRQLGCVLERRWMNGDDARDRGMRGWLYRVSIAIPAVWPFEGLDIKLLWCTKSMLRKTHEVGMPFSTLISTLKAASPYLAGEPIEILIANMKASVPFQEMKMDESGDMVLPDQCCACGKPARYIMGRFDAPVLSCNKYRPCAVVQYGLQMPDCTNNEYSANPQNEGGQNEPYHPSV